VLGMFCSLTFSVLVINMKWNLQSETDRRRMHLELETHYYSVGEKQLQTPFHKTFPIENPNGNFIEASGLQCIITGMEHTPTDLIAELLMNVPCLVGAAETGFLLADSPSDVKSLSPWITRSKLPLPDNYALRAEDIHSIQNTSDFAEMYRTLRHKSPVFNGGLKDDKHCELPLKMIDKTSDYIFIENFQKVLEKTQGVPVVVVKKSYKLLQISWARSGYEALQKEYYDAIYDNVGKMKNLFPGRIKIINHDDILKQPDETFKDLFEFLGRQWIPKYKSMSSMLKKYRDFPDYDIKRVNVP